jgi:hypothetical protein
MHPIREFEGFITGHICRADVSVGSGTAECVDNSPTIRQSVFSSCYISPSDVSVRRFRSGYSRTLDPRHVSLHSRIRPQEDLHARLSARVLSRTRKRSLRGITRQWRFSRAVTRAGNFPRTC